MNEISLRKIKQTDEQYFSKWWRDKELIALTSGDFNELHDSEVDKYFFKIQESKNDFHFIIVLGDQAIGHISLCKRKRNQYETQIIIGEKKFWGQGYGTEAIKKLIKFASKKGISNIFLDVRPGNTRAIRSYEKAGFQKVGFISNPSNSNLPKVLRMSVLI